ncbi:DNA mismatch repair protein MutS [Candidatus Woesearchaeota archaeon]|nr:DNA mismatch repair protein MutS [Candidatus Woesearchaeota archaeon]
MMQLTPAMQQYMEVKQQYPDTIVLFRMGDFYETFYEDAKTAARELNIVLTARGKGETRAPLAGIPFHSLDQYLGKLIRRGYKVTIVEQMEDPKFAKGVVKRDVVRIITPGTVMESNILDQKSNNYIMAVSRSADSFGIALADISTGEFLVTNINNPPNNAVNNFDNLLNEIARYEPKECILPLSLEDTELLAQLRIRFTGNTRNLSNSSNPSDSLGVIFNSFDDRHFWKEAAYKLLLDHFNTANLQGYGLDEKNSEHELAINAAGALLSYLKFTQRISLKYINKINLLNKSDFMAIDSVTQRNLELARNIRDNSTDSTLLEVLDKTLTSMGSRLLKSWLLKPLLKVGLIKARQDAVEIFFQQSILRDDVRDLLAKVSDLERLISRVNFGTANARDLIGIKNALAVIPEAKKLLREVKFASYILTEIYEIPELKEIAQIIENAIKEDAPASTKEGNIINQGFNSGLDKLKEISRNSKQYIALLEEKEKSRTGIKSLKIRFNNVFGYYIEITKPNLHLVPKDYVRKQTQVNSERFITEELKEHETLILGAEEKICALEYEIFTGIINKVSFETHNIQKIAEKLSLLDVLCSLAKVAAENDYVKPIVDSEDRIILHDSRHPVVEKIEKNFVANNCLLEGSNRLQIITGPNMAGKSTYMRQVALIVLMMQIGSFVPAKKAEIGIVDRIFTRVGAYDDLTHGQSTFMVEMNETANIVNNATEKSLVILDEIGRGTSTFDGISIAWAVAEHLHEHNKAKTLFATHYHQLNKLAEHFSNIKNYNIAVLEKENDIVFLRKIVAGGTDKSYGIHVAKLAGMPESVIHRSRQIMEMLEVEDEIGDRLEEELKENKTSEPSNEKNKFGKKIDKEELNKIVNKIKKEKQKSLLEL